MNNQPTLTPEESLIFTVSKIDLKDGDSIRLHNILKQDPDWSTIERYANQLGLEPLLFKHISQNGNAHNVPDQIMLSLKKSYINQLGTNFKIYREVKNILEVMNMSNIPIVLLKGAFLAKYIYGDIALRPMVDIDVLVRERDSEIVQRKLIELGFKKIDTYYTSDFHEALFSEDAKHLTPLVKPRVGCVEVHLNIFPKVRYDSKEMRKVWLTLVTINLDGVQIKSLSPEYQLLHLCLHLYYHITNISSEHDIRFFWFCDIHESIIYYGDKFNWESFCGIVDSVGVGAQVGTILAYIRHNWNTPIPETILHSLESGVNGHCLTTIIRSILDGSKAKRSHIHRYIKKTTVLLAKNGDRNSLYYLWKEFFPKRSHLIVRYALKDSLFVYVYYTVHICILFTRAVTSTAHNAVHLLRKQL